MAYQRNDITDSRSSTVFWIVVTIVLAAIIAYGATVYWTQRNRPATDASTATTGVNPANPIPPDTMTNSQGATDNGDTTTHLNAAPVNPAAIGSPGNGAQGNTAPTAGGSMDTSGSSDNNNNSNGAAPANTGTTQQ